MKIVTHPDVIEIAGEELETILSEAIQQRHGRTLDQITWVNVTEYREIGRRSEAKCVNLNATLKPKE